MQRGFRLHQLPHFLLAAALLFVSVTALSARTDLEIRDGDHVTIVGNALAERMNHHGYFETRLQARFPDKHLVIRNLGKSGNVVEEKRNLFVTDGPDYARKSKEEVKRARQWTSRKRWLSLLDTDVLLVMYGFNESFRGPDKVDAFRQHLEQFVTRVLNTRYNDTSAPRVALVSPIAFEDLNDPELPDGTTQNRNLDVYTRAIKSVASKHNLPFVNLFKATKDRYASADRNWTFNGVHLTPFGYKQLAGLLDRKLFGKRSSSFQHDRDALRQAILDKNEYWFDWYRINDATNVYGRRSHLSYEPNEEISNWDVYKREQKILRTMVQNRDRKIWAKANGNDYTVADDNLPDQIEVKTNAPGDNPDGSYSFLGGKEAIDKMKVHEDLDVNLFASEEMFPELINPVQMAFDTEGRLWVLTWEGYPNYEPPGEKKDELIILEDTNNDGVADERTIFADQLKNPIGFNFCDGGVLITQAPYVTFFKDTDGDDRADEQRRVLGHISSADTHHTLNSYSWGPGGSLFFSEGVFSRTQIETPYGVKRNRNGTIWRFEPDSFDVQRYNTFPGSQHGNLHGHAISRWNQQFVYDASPAEPFHATLFSGSLPFPKNHPQPPKLYEERTRPEAAATILSSGHFPSDMQGNLLVANVIGFQGIQQYTLERKGASFQATEIEPIVESSDPNFRPVAMAFGPGGALYFTDWQNPLIGHMQHHIRDPNRDHSHGRVYRITHEDRPLTEEKRIEDQSVPALLDLLKKHDGHVRTRAKLELDKHESSKVVSAADTWVKNLDPDAPDYQHHVLEGLWVHQWHNEVDVPLLKRVLHFDNPRARAAAVRILGYWREDVDGALDLMQDAVNDPDPLVRLEAVRALSFFRNKRAMTVALQALKHDMDRYLRYTLKQTTRALKPQWMGAFASGTAVVTDNYRGLQYLVDRVPESKEVSQLLLDQPSTPAVLRTILQQPDISLDRRQEALRNLAGARGMKPVEILMDILTEAEGSRQTTELVTLLEDLDRDQLAPRADQLEQLARSTDSPDVRRTAFIALATIDQNVNRIQPIASASVQHARSFLTALERMSNTSIRKSAYDLVRSLVFDPMETGSLQKRALRVLSDLPVPAQTRFEDLARAMDQDIHMLTAATEARPVADELDRIPPELAETAVTGVKRHLETLSAKRRSKPDVKEVISFAESLTDATESEKGKRLSNQLSALNVRVITIKTVPGQMKYDTESITVRPGKTVALRLVNEDELPHNLVITVPGAYERVGKASMSQEDGPSHDYVPTAEAVRNKIRWHTSLLRGGESERLVVEVPSEPDDYPYLCTFPGHWKTMKGVMHVRTR